MTREHVCPLGHRFSAAEDDTDPVCPHCTATVDLNRTGPALAADGPVSLPEVPGYDVLDELGRGGVGIVYRARHLKLNRLVALKMLLAGGRADADALTRFRLEAESLARLRHPHIVQVYEVSELRAAGVSHPYLALELCDGGSLAARLDGTPWPPREAARLIGQLASAMQAAHDAGVVHRDLKPANVLLSFSREPEASALADALASGSRLNGRVPKITDFGLAKLVQGEGSPVSGEPTATGAILGTPSYMSPEQAGGRRHQIGPATDVWSLGALLYELLTGRPPFKGSTPVETVVQVVREEPVPPRRLRPQVPVDVETICLKCLHKEPHKRYATAQELADDLDRFLRSEPIRARRTGPLGRLWRWCRRNPLAASVSAAAAVIILTLSVLYERSLFRRIKETREALQREKEARAEARKEHLKTVAAHEEAQDTLARSYYEQARTVRRSAQPGRKWRALGLLSETTRLLDRRRPPVETDSAGVLPTRAEVRSEAVAALELADARPAGDVEAVSAWGCALSRDGTRAVSVARGRRGVGLRVHDLATGRQVARIDKVLYLNGRNALSPDGRTLAVALGSPLFVSVDLIDLPEGQVRRSVRVNWTQLGRTNTPPLLQFGADGRYLAAAWSDRVVAWDLEGKDTPCLVEKLKAGTPGPGLAFGGDGRTLYYPAGERAVAAADLTGKAATRTIELSLPLVRTGETTGPFGHTRPLDCSPAAPLLAVACVGADGDVVVLLHDAARGQSRQLQGDFSARDMRLAFSPDGSHLAVSARGGSIECFPLAPGAEKVRLERAHRQEVTVLGWDGAGRLVSCGRAFGGVQRWEVGRTEVRRALALEKPGPDDLAFSADGGLLAARVGRRIEVLDRAAGAARLGLDLPGDGREVPSEQALAPGALLFRADDKELAWIDSRRAAAWAVADGRLLWQKAAASAWCPGAFRPDGSAWVLLVSPREGMTVWDAREGKAVRTLAAPRQAGRALLAADGTSAVSLGMGVPFLSRSPLGAALADPLTGRRLGEVRLRGDSATHHVLTVRFSADGRRLALLRVPMIEGGVGFSEEGASVLVADARTGATVADLPCPSLPSCLALGRGGRLLALGFEDGTAQLWDVDEERELFRWSPHAAPVKVLAFSGEAVIASGAENDHFVHLLDLTALRRRLRELNLDW